jgi:hypothetical protein
MKGVQCYKCKDCSCDYTVDYSIIAEKEKKKRFGLSMHSEGLDFHSTGGLLNAAHVTVMNRVKKYGSALSSVRNPKPVKIMEPDELHACVKSRKTADGYGLPLIEMQENALISFLETEELKRE